MWLLGRGDYLLAAKMLTCRLLEGLCKWGGCKMGRRSFGALTSVMAIVVALAASPVAAQQSRAGLEGKSRFEIQYGFVSGATAWAVELVYRTSPLWDVTGGFTSLSGPGGSATGFGVGGRYHFQAGRDTETKSDPYIFAGVASATVVLTGVGTASATGFGMGVGTDLAISDALEGFGSVAWSTSGGASAVGYTAGLRWLTSERFYTSFGITGSGGSSVFFVGVGSRF